ncbi:MAG TPA: aspartyl protease family protein [Isosphaeraceae bacterium]|jgi:hypothetical protein|nr:aspartyl protease family protein [Isosphaeraceae bacterium]
MRRFGKVATLGLVAVAAAWAIAADKEKKAPDVGRSYKIPYKLTDTNHALVRARVNGKGPFNFLVDTGAPALFLGTEAAKTIGLEPSRTDFWTVVDRLDFEGGAQLRGMKARIEDPFQLEGMNALGLPGARIDGILGFTVLARYRIEMDPTADRMTWTRLDFEPKEPFIPAGQRENAAPPEVKAMNAIGPLAKLAAGLMGKQPEEQLHPRGLLGIELDGDRAWVARVLPGTAAARADVRAGDVLIQLNGRLAATSKAAHKAAASIKVGDRVTLRVLRGEETIDLTLTAGEGF